MASDVSICSAALQLLGDAPISSLSETSKRAILCNSLYTLLRDDTLRRHNWNCLITRAPLAPLADTPVSEWSYQFSLPGAALRLLSVTDVNGNPEDYVLEGRRVLANSSTVYVRYIEAKPEQDWDSNLVNVMTKRMEMDLAYPITKSTSLRDSLRQEFYAAGVGILATAKTVDGQEDPPQDWGDSPLIAVRGG